MGEMQSGIQVRLGHCPEHGPFESRALMLMGKLMAWSKCPECNRVEEDRQAQEKRVADEAERQRRMEARLSRAGIPLRFRGKTFETFDANSAGKESALKVAAGFADDFPAQMARGTTLVFSGKPGTGKSHLAIAVCLEIMPAGHTAMYLNALDAIRMIRGTWKRDSERSESAVMNDLANVDLLVLDEVGAQYGTEGEQVVMFDIINRRYQDQRPMILLTNQDKDGFKQYLGDRAFDRLREAGKWVTFDWASHRGKQN